jgi:hypothetical protein
VARSPKDYEAFKASQAAISRERSAQGRDIAPLPPVADPARKEACRYDLLAFFDAYFRPGRFSLPWSPPHLTAVARMQAAILEGGQFALAMPRASGKSAMAEAAALHALLYGHRRFVVIVGASEDAASENLASIKVEIETNDLLLADFPEVCYPVRMLEGIHHRANGQTLGGERTRIVWTDDRVTLPTVPGSPASGARLRAAGITGRIRGMKATTASGESIRPDLCLVDDPSTDESATSPAGNAKREKVVNGAVLGLAGPTTRISAFAAVTVIAPGDLAERLLDRDRHPVWNGERTRMVVAWPTNQDLWDRYADIWRNDRRGGGDGSAATAFYRANRPAMDAGAAVSWPERFRPGELSAVQSAMNLRLERGEAAFLAEYQNDPQAERAAGQVEDLEPDAVAARVNGVPRGTVPRECTRLTGFVDVGAKILHWCVVGWTESFTGSVVDYGTVPKQNRAYFTAADARPSLEDLAPGVKEESRVYAGVDAALKTVLGRPYPREGGGELDVEKCLVDSGWLPDPVHQVCRKSQFVGRVLPSKGMGLTAASKPMRDYHPKAGETAGADWRLVPVTGGGRGRQCNYDANTWKTFAATCLLAPLGAAGAMTLFGRDRAAHQLFADHLCAEFRIRTQGRGRTLDEWRARPGNPDNHFWDTVVGCCVAASVAGLKWDSGAAVGDPMPPKERRKVRKLSDLYARKAGGKR